MSVVKKCSRVSIINRAQGFMSTTAWLVGGGGEEATRMSTHWEAIGTIKMPPYCVEIKMNTTDAYVLT